MAAQSLNVCTEATCRSRLPGAAAIGCGFAYDHRLSVLLHEILRGGLLVAKLRPRIVQATLDVLFIALRLIEKRGEPAVFLLSLLAAAFVGQSVPD